MTAVVRLRWRPFRLPMRHRFEAAHGALQDREGVLVQLVAESGLVGTGEASPLPSLRQGHASDVLALLGAHATTLLTREGIPDGPGANALRCALDVAMLDLRGRTEDRSAAALLAEAMPVAGASAAREPAAWVQANAVIGSGAPVEVARYATDAWLSGYRVLKLKVGATNVEEDVARVAAVREACPDATLRLDANGAWDEATAVAALNAFVPYRIEFIEQPVAAREVEALARVRERSPMRIAADEAVADADALAQVLDLRAADLVVLKPMLLGGLTPAIEVASRAFERGIDAFATTTFDSSIGTAAALHLAAVLPWDAAHGLGTGDHLAADVTTAPLVPSDGHLALPSGPGLGVEIDDVALDAVATAPWTEAPWTEASLTEVVA